MVSAYIFVFLFFDADEGFEIYYYNEFVIGVLFLSVRSDKFLDFEFAYNLSRFS